VQLAFRWKIWSGVILALSGLTVSGFSQDRVVQEVSASARVQLERHLPAWVRPSADLGPAEAQPLNHLTATLARSADRQQAFQELLREQQTPGSPNFHKWLTPAQIGEQFGVSENDLRAVTGWLTSQGFQVIRVSNSRTFIEFKGTTSIAQQALGVQFHNYRVGGDTLLSNDREPSIPAALAPVLKGFTGLSASFSQPQNIASVKQKQPDLTHCSGGDCTYLITPSDFSAIYNATPAYQQGVTGSGQTIGIIGRARVLPQDVTAYGTQTHVSMPLPNVIIPPSGTDPGPALSSLPQDCNDNPSAADCLYLNDQGEATLDVQRSGGVAYGANLDLIVSASSTTQDGVDIATQYAIDSYGNGVQANILSISFGVCESEAGQSDVQGLDALFQQAAAQGISVFISAGDAAASGCAQAFTYPDSQTQVLNINALCSSSYVTCVGGTEFNDAANPSQYWSSTNSSSFGSALGYIPEGAWNEPFVNGSYEVAGTGGGVSQFISTPTWQTGTGVPGTQGRYVPDVAFSSSQHDGYFGCLAAAGASCVADSTGTFYFEAFAGTSAAAPGMAGVMALVDQSAGGPQGVANPELYHLAANPAANVFHDVTVASSGVTDCDPGTPSMCNNSTPSNSGLTGGLAGYTVQTGYDEVTGLGSVNIGNLVSTWQAGNRQPSPTVSISASEASVAAGQPVSFTATLSSSTTPSPTGTVQFIANGANLGSAVALSGDTATLNGQVIWNYGNYTVGAAYNGDANYWGASSNTVSLTVTPLTATVAASLSAATIAPGSSVTITATVSGPQGAPVPTGSVQFQSNGTSLGSAVPLSNGTAVLKRSFPVAGSHTITAQYLGDTVYNGASAAAGTLTVANLATPVITSSVSPTAISVGGQATLSAIVSGPSGSPVPTGTVQFAANGTNLGSAVALSGGSATLSNQTFSQSGSYSITASYSGDAAYSALLSTPATLVVSPVAVPAITANPANITVAAGSSGSTTLTLSGISASPVTFACSGLPQGASCNFGSLSTSSTVSLQIATTGQTASLAPAENIGGIAYALTCPGLLALAGFFFRRRKMLPWSLLLVVFSIGLFMTGCGGSGGTGNTGGGNQNPPPTSSQTPAGTYNIGVTAAGGGQTATTTVTLVVQ
jgi:subtilase family serine protease